MNPLQSDNPNVIAQYDAIVQSILREINVKNISITKFCEDMGYDADNFLDCLNNVRDDFGYYLEILEKLKDY